MFYTSSMVKISMIYIHNHYTYTITDISSVSYFFSSYMILDCRLSIIL